MSKRDFYDVLGIGRDADEKEIKSAYRKLAMKNHPDRNPDDEAAAERFREASEAYEILKGPYKSVRPMTGLAMPHLISRLAAVLAVAVLVAAVASAAAASLIFLTRCLMSLMAVAVVQAKIIKAQIYAMILILR